MQGSHVNLQNGHVKQASQIQLSHDSQYLLDNEQAQLFMLTLNTQSLMLSLSSGLIKFLSGRGISNGLGISVSQNSELSLIPAPSGSSIASYRSIYLLQNINAMLFVPSFLLASPASKNALSALISLVYLRREVHNLDYTLVKLFLAHSFFNNMK